MLFRHFAHFILVNEIQMFMALQRCHTFDMHQKIELEKKGKNESGMRKKICKNKKCRMKILTRKWDWFYLLPTPKCNCIQKLSHKNEHVLFDTENIFGLLGLFLCIFNLLFSLEVVQNRTPFSKMAVQLIVICKTLLRSFAQKSAGHALWTWCSVIVLCNRVNRLWVASA